MGCSGSTAKKGKKPTTRRPGQSLAKGNAPQLATAAGAAKPGTIANAQAGKLEAAKNATGVKAATTPNKAAANGTAKPGEKKDTKKNEKKKSSVDSDESDSDSASDSDSDNDDAENSSSEESSSEDQINKDNYISIHKNFKFSYLFNRDIQLLKFSSKVGEGVVDFKQSYF